MFGIIVNLIHGCYTWVVAGFSTPGWTVARRVWKGFRRVWIIPVFYISALAFAGQTVNLFAHLFAHKFQSEALGKVGYHMVIGDTLPGVINEKIRRLLASAASPKIPAGWPFEFAYFLFFGSLTVLSGIYFYKRVFKKLVSRDGDREVRGMVYFLVFWCLFYLEIAPQHLGYGTLGTYGIPLFLAYDMYFQGSMLSLSLDDYSEKWEEIKAIKTRWTILVVVFFVTVFLTISMQLSRTPNLLETVFRGVMFLNPITGYSGTPSEILQ
jgi:hypothetical protein